TAIDLANVCAFLRVRPAFYGVRRLCLLGAGGLRRGRGIRRVYGLRCVWRSCVWGRLSVRGGLRARGGLCVRGLVGGGVVLRVGGARESERRRGDQQGLGPAVAHCYWPGACADSACEMRVASSEPSGTANTVST